jgi:hypothetical protein
MRDFKVDSSSTKLSPQRRFESCPSSDKKPRWKFALRKDAQLSPTRKWRRLFTSRRRHEPPSVSSISSQQTSVTANFDELNKSLMNEPEILSLSERTIDMNLSGEE